MTSSCYNRTSAVFTWWGHQMETFSVLLVLCVGNSLVTGQFPTQRPVTQSFEISFDLHLNKHLSKQSWGWWFETPSCSLWCHLNECSIFRMSEIFGFLCGWLVHFIVARLLYVIPYHRNPLSQSWPNNLDPNDLRGFVQWAIYSEIFTPSP